MRSFLVVILLSSLASTAVAQGGGIETLSGEMLFSGGTRVSISHLHRERSGLMSGSDRVADVLNRSSREDRTTLSFDYGISFRFTLTALMPRVVKSSCSSGTRTTSEGLGDLVLLGKWLLAHEYWQRSGWHVAMAAGTELPTGEVGVRDGGSLLSPGMQPGSGSWDPFVSLSANLELDRWRFDATALYKDNRSGHQAYRAGDQFTFDLVGAYRFLHAQYPGPSANVKLGLLYRDQASARWGGVEVADSRSELWLGRIALAWHPQPQWDLGLRLDLPLSETYGGSQLGLDYQVSLAVGLRF